MNSLVRTIQAKGVTSFIKWLASLANSLGSCFGLSYTEDTIMNPTELIRAHFLDRYSIGWITWRNSCIFSGRELGLPAATVDTVKAVPIQGSALFINSVGFMMVSFRVRETKQLPKLLQERLAI